LKRAQRTGTTSDLIAANKAAARAAGLRYVSDTDPGITRHKAGGGFVYQSASGKRITDEATLARIRALVIPPAWTDVWITPHSNGHIQAIGRDARGRKQYRYHAAWREARDHAKYHKMIEFAEALPKIRQTVRRRLSKPGLPRDKVLAAVLAIMEKTLIRVGNDEYANANGSYGLTTMRDKHARISQRKVEFRFRGKSGVEHEIDLEDPKLVEIVRKCRDLPGQELFQYRDDRGKVCDITSTDVNAYLREISGGDFTAKDFRTWAGTVLAARALREIEPFDSKTQAKKNLVRAVEKVAMRLGNTKAVCRKCYIHPAIIDSYLDGELVKHLTRKADQLLAKSSSRLSPEEAAVLSLIRRSITRRAA
jgi:DNA topoisomerase-1